VGERNDELARVGNVVIEQILSGALDAPVDYEQRHHEWVVVVGGGAVLEADGERMDLGPGDWVLLPAATPHRLVQTRPGTSWVAVHIAP
jgi:cupin 2 domain-containing protein